MKTDNELIAEFHHHSTSWTVAYGVKAISKTIGPNFYGGTDSILITNIDYDKDWNLLMSVIEKIYDFHRDEITPGLGISKLSFYTPIAYVHMAVVEFVKWHNEKSA